MQTQDPLRSCISLALRRKFHCICLVHKSKSVDVVRLKVNFYGFVYLQAEIEQLSMISIQLVSKFLFTTGFRTKKTVR